ncbi:MAG: YicC family protein [bacterium]|nr:YicC family protein [bacterium]
MLSMTGFGNAEVTRSPLTLTVELRSVNHRFLDVSLRLPPLVAAYEIDVRQFLKANVARGRVTVAVNARVIQDPSAAALDGDRLTVALALLQQAAAKVTEVTGRSQEITLDHLLAVPDLLKADDVELPADDVKAALLEGLAGAMQELQAMKDKEGAALVAEMNGRLDTISGALAQVTTLAPQAAEEAEKKLQERLDKILDEPLEPQRLAQEVALLADKANINEEIERLGIHLVAFRDTLAGGGQAAKRLNFLLQEMHREVNTMGSKTNLMDITSLVITMKDEVESLREQVMNLE